jgi:hypothetical protein
MLAIDEKRKQVLKAIESMPEEQLDLVSGLLQKIELLKKDSIEYLFAEAVAEYGNTLKKLAE